MIKKTPWHKTCSKKCQQEAYFIREANKALKND